jgi:hypothetical protein
MRFPASGGTDFEPLAEGVHVGVCDMIVDLGVQPARGIYGPKREVYFRWQVPAERITYTKDGKELEGPRVVGQSYTASMSPKANLRKMIEAWRGKKFASDGEAEAYEIEVLLGKACQVQVAHSKDGKYANVSTVVSMPKGMKAPPVENGTVFYSQENDSTYEQLPPWLKKKIDEQLDPMAISPPATGVGARPTSSGSGGRGASTATTSHGTTRMTSADEQEASRAAAKAAERDDFEDSEIPFN